MVTYKIIFAARAYVHQYVLSTVRGESRVPEDDVRAKVFLIYRDGDPSDPANYRLIAVLNTEYQLLRAVLSEIIRESLA